MTAAAAAGPDGTTQAEGLARDIDALLPQTQCRRCGFDGCRPYADALARGETALNRCPPGGAHLIRALSALLGRPGLPLDPDCGHEAPPQVARIVEPACIGCAKCIDACPTDAIAGARKWMHAVVAADCSGCELCVPACPVDCIVMAPTPALPPVVLDAAGVAQRAHHFRRLYESRQRRLQRNEQRWREALQARLQPQGSAP